MISQPILDQVIEKGFPLKIQIPMSMSIRANIVFEVFRQVSPSQIPAGHFDIPLDYALETRKEAQKILVRPKKRMVLANMLI